MQAGTHQHDDDPRNEHVHIWVDGQIVPRHEARVSVFDSGFLLGDGLWESLRIKDGRIGFLDAHLDRLYEAMHGLGFQGAPDRVELIAAIRATLAANAMRDGAHLRLMITRGVRATPWQDPRIVVGSPTVVIVPEFKVPPEGAGSRPVTLFTVHVRRGRPDVQDPRLNTHSKLNCVTACIQANAAGVDEALMLDPQGFVATCNSTHFFIVRNGEVWTSTGDYCLDGITRRNVIRLCERSGIPVFQRNFALSHVYGADEAFITGTFGGVGPVGVVDGRTIGAGVLGPVTERLQGLYGELFVEEGLPIDP